MIGQTKRKPTPFYRGRLSGAYSSSCIRVGFGDQFPGGLYLTVVLVA